MEKHSLHHEFPQHESKISELKVSNSHFRNLFDQYHHIDKEIHRVEVTGTFTDSELNQLRSQRLHLKDDLLKMIESN
jgi:uncharacterized protein YdcH (DUF465 family)